MLSDFQQIGINHLRAKEVVGDYWARLALFLVYIAQLTLLAHLIIAQQAYFINRFYAGH